MPERYADLRVEKLLEDVAARTSAPGGGSVAAITAALAAGLVAMAAHYSDQQLPDADAIAGDADGLRLRATDLADADAEAYQAAMESGPSVASMRRATEIPLEVAEIGAEIAHRAVRLAQEGNPHLRGDATTAARLAAGVVRSAAGLVRLNVDAVGGNEELARRAQQCERITDVALARLSS